MESCFRTDKIQHKSLPLTLLQESILSRFKTAQTAITKYELTTGIDDIKVLAWAWARITKNAGHCYKGATWFIITYELYFVCSVYNFAWYVRCFSFTTDGNLWPTIVCSVNLEYFWRCTAQMHDIIFTHELGANIPIYKQIWNHYLD